MCTTLLEKSCMVFAKKSESNVRMYWSIVVQSFSLQRKSDESTKHYFIQMLFASTGAIWQTGKNSRMCTKDQGRPVQSHFIEIHHVFANQKLR